MANRTSCLLVALAAAAAVSGAHAQSRYGNIDIYGRINLSYENQKTTRHTNVMQDNASRWGIVGEENISSDVSAIFNLESGFNADNGMNKDPAASFDRESWVGLASKKFGTLRMGATTSPVYYAAADYVSMHNHDTGTSSDALFGFDATGGHLTNMTAYKTPAFNDATVEVAYALAEKSGGRSVVNVAYNQDIKALHVGAGYAQSKDRGVSNSTDTMYVVRALYDITDALAAGGYWEYDKYDQQGHRNNLRGAVKYTVGANEFHVNVGYTNGFSKTEDNGALQWTLGYNYNLSPRTKVYAFYTRIDNEKNASYGVDEAGVNFASFAVGLRHNF
ncbi:porin [Uliginosibacterium sp. sgz301328]|uniref:porin n=1 Tax=Uliginosibacterium sp. sgz301328 TaxID=3243764 RepID=UPI00359E03E5